MNKSTFKCHLCGEPFTIVEGQGKGVMLRCDTPAPACLAHENVYGFGGTEKEAAEIAKQKYRV
jgi:hypothetical protein